MNDVNIWDIETPQFRQRAWLLNDHTIRMERDLRAAQDLSILQITGPYWMMTVAENDPEWVWVLRDGEERRLKGRVTSFLPPFSSVWWRFKAGNHRVSYIVSYRDLPTHLTRQGPVSFLSDVKELPSQPDAVVDYLEQNIPRSLPISPSARVPETICRLKQHIDQNYSHPFSLIELAKEWGRSPTVLARQFRSAFGISPSRYRVRLRCFSALYQLQATHLPVALCAADAGYNNVGLFNRQFQGVFKTAPSVFRGKTA